MKKGMEIQPQRDFNVREEAPHSNKSSSVVVVFVVGDPPLSFVAVINTFRVCCRQTDSSNTKELCFQL
jgi:hypothetical protein